MYAWGLGDVLATEAAHPGVPPLALPGVANNVIQRGEDDVSARAASGPESVKAIRLRTYQLFYFAQSRLPIKTFQTF